MNAFNHKCDAIDGKLSARSDLVNENLRNRQPPTPTNPQSFLEILKYDPTWALRKSNVEQSMALASGDAAVVRFLEEGLGAWFQEIGQNILKQKDNY